MALAAAKGKNQVVLKEIMEFAEYLGMDPVEDGDLLWIAEQARNAPLPAPWSEHQGEDGNTYYYNSATDDSVWEHPLDEYYRNLYRKHKEEKEEQAARDAAYAKEAAMKENVQEEKQAAKKARAEKRLRKKIRAATMVQKVWRGKIGRRKMNQEISLNAELMFWAASKLQAVFRSKVGRRRAHEAKLEKLATKIQARFRGRRLRKMVIQNVSELVAAITVQRLWRGKQIRREFLAKRNKIQKQLDWEMENAAASRIQAIWRFKTEMRRKKQEDMLRKIFGGKAAGLSPEEDAAITIQRAAKKKWKWQPVVSDAMKFKMFQNMQAQKFDNKKAKLEAQRNEITGQMMAHDLNQMAGAAGKRREAKDMKAEMQERARLEAENAGPDPKSMRAKARAEKRQKKLNARRELMVRMQTAAAVMVQRAFRRRMFRKRMRLLSRRTHVAAAKIQLAWRWHLSRIKKKEKHYIVKRLAILMDSLTHSLAEREREVEQRDSATYIQTMWRGYMARELLSVMQAEHSAACSMQRAVRGWLLRMWLKRSRAAIRIQSAFRGFRVRVRIARAKARDRARREREREIRDRRRRREERKKHEVKLKKEEEAAVKEAKEKQAKQEAAKKQRELEELKQRSAVKIQATFRAYLTRNIVFPLLLEQRRLNAEADRIRLNQRLDAALTVQAMVRGWRERRNLRRKLAAIYVQKIWRGFLCRTGPYLQAYSARVIQSCFRGHYTRNYLAAYLETQALSDAATQIQTKFRTFAVKRRVSRWELMANTVQSAFRGYLAREYVRKKRVDVYATKLQSVFRGWKGRQTVKTIAMGKEDRAASSIQAVWRGRQTRQAILRDMYHWCSAFQIQRWFRKRQRRRYRAATAIQGMWRGNRAKVETHRRRSRKDQIIVLREKRREAAIKMQRWFRRARISRMPLHNAAVRVQATWRGILGRKIAARERFLFEQKYGNYKEMMLDMYSQIDASAGPGLDEDGGGGGGGGRGGGRGGKGRGGGGRRKKKGAAQTRKELMEEAADPFRVSAQSLEDDMGVKIIWLKFDKETANNMAQYFYRRNKPLAALQYIEKSLWQDQRLKQRDFVAKTCLHFSNVLGKLERHEEALKLAEQSLILFQAEQQLAKQKAAEMGEELIEPMIRADPTVKPGARGGLNGGGGKGGGGGGGFMDGGDGEDEIADTLQAGIAISYHNMAVQQLCCNLVQDATESTEQALRLGKACIEEWHPWVKQIETTHLACIKLSGGYPDFAGGGSGGGVPAAQAGGPSRRRGGGGGNSSASPPRRRSGSSPRVRDVTNNNNRKRRPAANGSGSAIGRAGSGVSNRKRNNVNTNSSNSNPYADPYAANPYEQVPPGPRGRRSPRGQQQQQRGRRAVNRSALERRVNSANGRGGRERGAPRNRRQQPGRGGGGGSVGEQASLPNLSARSHPGEDYYEDEDEHDYDVAEEGRAMRGPPRWSEEEIEMRARRSAGEMHDEGGGGGRGGGGRRGGGREPPAQAWESGAVRVVDWPVSDDEEEDGAPPRRRQQSPAGEQSFMTDNGEQMELYEERPPSQQYGRQGGGGSRSGRAGSSRSSGANKSRERQRRGPEQFDGDSQWRAAIM